MNRIEKFDVWRIHDVVNITCRLKLTSRLRILLYKVIHRGVNDIYEKNLELLIIFTVLRFSNKTTYKPNN